jgi:hypothetical protein
VPPSRRISVWHLALLTPWLLSAAGFFRTFNDNSYLWHVRAGDIQVATGRVLTSDPFSFTMSGSPWRTQSWLGELGYHVLDEWNGLQATPWITASMSALLFAALGLIAYRSSRSLPTTVSYLVVSALVLAGFLNPRPVIFSFPLFALLVVADGDRRLRWVHPLVLWIWASVHGSFVIGLAYLGLRALGRGLSRREVGRLLVAGGATLLTAHGWGVLEVLGDFAGNRDAIELMTEWAPPDLLSIPFLPLFALLLGLVWLASKGRISGKDWWLLVPFAALSVSASRAVPPAWIALAPIATRFSIPVSGSATIRKPIALVLGVAIVFSPLVIPREFRVDETRFPVEAAQSLTSERVFHDDAVGGWLTYAQWPDRLTYIDDRAELFGERIRLMALLRGGEADWREEFERFSIDEVLIAQDTALANLLFAEGWERAYEDAAFVVLREPS